MNQHEFRKLQPGARLFALTLLSLCDASAWASGSVVNKVYAPYVQPLEKEVEYRYLGTAHAPDQADQQWHRLGFGLSPVDRWFTELYVIATKAEGTDLSIEAYEFEARWQLSEQGEYALDWGALLEIEKLRAENAWEVSTGIIALKEWPQFTATANLTASYEWGDTVEEELEAAGAVQIKYRWKPELEPGFELFSSDEETAAGPVLLGQLKLTPGHNVFWQAGYLFGLQSDSADTLSIGLEYEFF